MTEKDEIRSSAPTSRSPRRLRRLTAAFVGALTVAAGVPVVLAATAEAAAQPGCVPDAAGTVTCDYTAVGTHTFVVPDGVTAIDVTARGGMGANTSLTGGFGTDVNA